ncbi:MAG TPA: MlaD family protein [Candidatus Acidoferrales bacterium]|nr:MlaD family protein [Candidatus Acidoferrales bacterium]
MAQRKHLSWTELRVGVFVLVALLLLAVAIFYVTGQGILRPKYTLITYLPEVENLQYGAPVDLDGIQIGTVQRYSFNPHPEDRLHNILLTMRVDKRFQDQIRTDSQVTLETQGLLGDRFVAISRGLTGTVIPQNGVVEGTEVPEIKDVVERSMDVVQNLGVLSKQFNEIATKVNNGEGTLGKFMNDPSFYNHLNRAAGKIDTMIASVQEGNGSIGKLYATDELYKKVDSTVGRVDDAMAAVQQQKGTVGKLIYDPQMAEDFKGIAQKGNAMMADIRDGKGTLGKLATDDVLYNNLRDASANVRDASAKLNSNQGTAGKFFSDPALYDNLSGLSGDMRLLVSDFRQNPKKFLHVKLAIF